MGRSVGIKSYKDLAVWRRGMDIAARVYELTKNFPEREVFGLTAQMRRASVSVPSNIAEGRCRQHRAEFRHFLYLALGSLAELETQMLIAAKVGLLNDSHAQELGFEITTLRKMLVNLVKKLGGKC